MLGARHASAMRLRCTPHTWSVPRGTFRALHPRMILPRTHEIKADEAQPFKRPLGFDLTEREVRRAGLDHWEHVDLRVHDSWRAFVETTVPTLGKPKASISSSSSSRGDEADRPNVFLVSKRLKLGSTPIADVAFPPATGAGAGGVVLVFGNEVDGLSGLDQDARESLPAVYLPMNEGVIRSYNLSNAVAMAVYEVHRQRSDSLKKHP